MINMSVSDIVLKYSKAETAYEFVTSYYWDFLKDSTESEGYFAWLCICFEEIIRSQKKNLAVYLKSEQSEEHIGSIYVFIDRALKSISIKNPDSDIFYSELWKQINNDVFFATDENRIDAVYCCVLSKYIPYYRVPQYSLMENAKYAEITDRLIHEIESFRYGANVRYEQLTQTAQYALEIMEGLETKEEKEVFLSHAFKIMAPHETGENKGED